MSKAQLLTLWTNNLTVFILVNTGDAFMCDSFRLTIVNFVYWTDVYLIKASLFHPALSLTPQYFYEKKIGMYMYMYNVSTRRFNVLLRQRDLRQKRP